MMLVIRKEQMQVLAEFQREAYELRMVSHLRAVFPDAIQNITDVDLRRMIQKGIAQAVRYEISREIDVARYLHFMILLFPDFDTDPSTSWAQVILKSALHPELKLDRLTEAVQFGKSA